MIHPTTINLLARLEQEMGAAGRPAEAAALQEAVLALAQPSAGYLAGEQVATRLGISLSVVEQMVAHGRLEGIPLAKRWLISTESVERLIQLRDALLTLEREGNPTDEELAELFRRPSGSRSAPNVEHP
jgi:excisionase family DNA binding protein